jgi:hypothetical protein
MSRPAANGTALLVVMMLGAAGIAIVEFAVAGGGLLLTLALWTAIVQGSVAVVAATEYTGARWVGQVRGELLAAARLLPFLLVLFLLLWPQLELYGWAASPGSWLNRPFFVARNAGLLAATAVVGGLFAARARRRDPSARRFAVAYLALYAANQTLVAFDWVMSLSYPWVSSMFGLYFLVEALYAGIALSGLLFLVLDRRRRGTVGGAWSAGARDAGLLLFGFSVLWGGLFFAQFLLIWYGNLPEEVSYIVARLSSPVSRPLIPAFIGLCWGLPFFLLLSAWGKRSVRALGIASVAVLLGLAAERLVFVTPELPLRGGLVLVENLMLLAVWWVAVATASRPAEHEADSRGGVA